MAVYKRNGTWWYRFRFRGAHIRETSRSGNKGVAERLEREHRRRLELGQGDLTDLAKPIKFATAAKDFIACQAHWADKTRIVHETSLTHLEPIFGRMLLNEINDEHISKYQRTRQKEKASGRTINIEVSLIRLVLKKHKRWSLIADGVKPQKENKERGRALSDDEQTSLLEVCKMSTSRSLYPAVLVSAHTGLRNKELRLLRWQQVDLVGNSVFPFGFVVVGKSKTEGGEGRVVPFSRTAQQTLQDWAGQFPGRKPTDAVWPSEEYALKGSKGTFGGKVVPFKTHADRPIASWKSAWQTAKKVAGVECRWHDLRHCFVSAITAGGAMDGTTQAIAGWMSPKMIERYSHTRNKAKFDAVAVLDRKPVDTKAVTQITEGLG